jgi:hypothetical protein
MAYVDLDTIHVPAAVTPAPAGWGLQVNANFDFLAGVPACRIVRTTGQSIPNLAETLITWQSATYQKGGTFWVVGTPSRLTAPIDGVYSIKYGSRWEGTSPGTGARSSFVKKNGLTTIDADDKVSPGPAWFTSNKLATEIDMAAGDYIEISAYQGNGAALSIGQTSPMWIAMSWLRLL